MVVCLSVEGAPCLFPMTLMIGHRVRISVFAFNNDFADHLCILFASLQSLNISGKKQQKKDRCHMTLALWISAIAAENYKVSTHKDVQLTSDLKLS